MQQITEHLYVLPAPFLGIDLFLYVVYSREQVVLIDSGINTTPHEYILPAFRQAGIKPALLVCTHGHVDHFGGNATLRDQYPDLKIALHHADVIWAEDHERHLHEMYVCMPQTWQFADGGKSHLEMCGANAAIDIHLKHGQQIQLGLFQWQVIDTPGHAPGEIVLHDAENGVVICGDTALGKGIQTPEGKRVPPYYADPSLYVVGIETAVALKGATYCTGHNGVLTYDQMVEFANESKEMVEWLDTYSFLKGKTLGYLTGADGGYRVVGESYIPDVAFISKAREPEPSREAYNPNPPDLAVEVLPPSNDADDMRIKVVNYLAAGTQVWVVQPDEQQVEVYIPGQPVTVLGVDGILDGRNLLPGFTLKISDIFAGI